MFGEVARHAALSALDLAEVALAVEAALHQLLERESGCLPFPPQLLAVEAGDALRAVDVLASHHALPPIPQLPGPVPQFGSGNPNPFHATPPAVTV